MPPARIIVLFLMFSSKLCKIFVDFGKREVGVCAFQKGAFALIQALWWSVRFRNAGPNLRASLLKIPIAFTDDLLDCHQRRLAALRQLEPHPVQKACTHTQGPIVSTECSC